MIRSGAAAIVLFLGTSAFPAPETPTSRTVCSIEGVYEGSCTSSKGENAPASVQLGFLGGLAYDNGFDWSHCADNYTIQYRSTKISDSDSIPLDQYPFNGGRLEAHPVVNGLGGSRASELWADVTSATDFVVHRLDRFDEKDPSKASRGFRHQSDTSIHQIDATHVMVDYRFTLTQGRAEPLVLTYHCASLTRTQ